METWSLLSLGLTLGIMHATDADHVAAVSTLVADGGDLKRAARIGGMWGLGHSLTVMLAGSLIIGFRLIVPERMHHLLELGVAVMLVGLGIRAVLRARNGDHAHAHPTRGGLQSFAVGVVHGLAGSAAVALAVLTQVDRTSTALSYLAWFSLGTIAGMGLLTTALALPLRALGLSFGRPLRILAGSASILVGCVLALQSGSGLIG